MTTVSATTNGITGTQIGTTGNPITANAIYTTLKNEMNTYTNIKETNAVVTMTGAGQQYSDTQIAHNLTSQRTTFAPSQIIGVAVAINVKLGTITSSPGFMPIIFKHIKIPAVQFETVMQFFVINLRSSDIQEIMRTPFDVCFNK